MAIGVATSPLKIAMSACRRGLLWATLFSFVINLLLLTLPLYLLQIFDRVLPARSIDTLLVLFALAAVALAVFGALDAIRGYLLARSGAWLDSELGRTIIGETIGLPSRRRASGLQAMRDLATVRAFLSGPAVIPVMDAPWAPIFLVVIFVLHPLLGALALGGAVLLLGVAAFGELTTRDPLMRAGGAAIDASTDVVQAIRSAESIDAMGMKAEVLNRWSVRNHEAVSLELGASERAATVKGASRFLRLLLQIGVLTLGAWLAIGGDLTIGGMTAASLLLARALAPVEQLIGASRSMIAARHAWHRIRSLLRTVNPRPEPMSLPPPTGRVLVEDLVFSYPGSRAPLIRNVSFLLTPGEALGVIGPTAVGKTTLAHLILGVLKPDAGRIRLDGIDVTAWSRHDLGRHVGYLPQDCALLAGTVRDNIARLRDGESQAVVEAARLAGAHEMILALPHGYETEICPRGVTLSGGQQQRIGLARALYGDPRLVVLDEPNAGLDRDGFAALTAAMAALKARSATVIVIAHAPQLLRSVDVILALRHGAAPLCGPRDQMIARLNGAQPRAPLTVVNAGDQRDAT